MSQRLLIRAGLSLFAVMFALFIAACGGGDDDDTLPTIDNNLDNIDNDVPPVDIDGPTQYPGQQPQDPPDMNPADPPAIDYGPFDFGSNIFDVPLDTNGTGIVTTNGFSPGQKIALVVVNLNPTYLDAHLVPGEGFPLLPESAYSVHADLVSSTASQASSLTPEQLLENTEESLGSLEDYEGVVYDGEQMPVHELYERSELAKNAVPYSVPEAKSTSAIQLGETRAFIRVQPRPEWPPREIPPDPANPDQDTSEFEWPTGYNCQHGRLVAIGQHCLVFLSTAINDGTPDLIQYTEARLNRLAREFDTVIYPTLTSHYGSVLSYQDPNIWRNVDRNPSPPITGADFGEDGQIARDLPGSVDEDFPEEEKIAIFLYNGDEGGFFIGAPRTGENEYGEPFSWGSTIYIGTDNFPANDNAWESVYSVMAHEFQHKLYNDHGLPQRPIVGGGGNYNWLNEGMSQLSIHLCGYTVNSGDIIHWAIDSQLKTYLENINRSAVPMDGNTQFPAGQQTQYGNGFLFFLYLHEHYPAGVGERIYNAARDGENDYIKLIETATDEPFEQTYSKFAIANFVDGIYKDSESDLWDPRFYYNTIDLRGTINLATGTVVLPGVRTGVYPRTGGYPVAAIHRNVIPWGADYLVFGNGPGGRNLQITLYSDQHFKLFVLPVTFDQSSNLVDITPGITIDY